MNQPGKTTSGKCLVPLTAGAKKKVILAGPGKGVDGTNEGGLDPSKHHIVSKMHHHCTCCQRCLTTEFKIVKGFITTAAIPIRWTEGSMVPVRGHPARARAAASSIVPHFNGSGASRGSGDSRPEGKLDGVALRGSATMCQS